MHNYNEMILKSKSSFSSSSLKYFQKNENVVSFKIKKFLINIFSDAFICEANSNYVSVCVWGVVW